jgi:hydrogenase maturation protease
MISKKKTFVLHVGNYLRGDERIGIHAVHILEQTVVPPKVELVDGDTGGFHLLSYFQEYNPLIFVNATMDGKPPGTVSPIMPKLASDFSRSSGAHDIGLRDLVESAALSGTLPPVVVEVMKILGIQAAQVM